MDQWRRVGVEDEGVSVASSSTSPLRVVQVPLRWPSSVAMLVLLPIASSAQPRDQICHLERSTRTSSSSSSSSSHDVIGALRTSRGGLKCSRGCRSAQHTLASPPLPVTVSPPSDAPSFPSVQLHLTTQPPLTYTPLPHHIPTAHTMANVKTGTATDLQGIRQSGAAQDSKVGREGSELRASWGTRTRSPAFSRANSWRRRS